MTSITISTKAYGEGRPAARLVLPFELRQVAAKYPVTLYTTTGVCDACSAGRQLLNLLYVVVRYLHILDNPTQRIVPPAFTLMVTPPEADPPIGARAAVGVAHPSLAVPRPIGTASPSPTRAAASTTPTTIAPPSPRRPGRAAAAPAPTRR